jgi:subtilisin family serine protease
MRSRAENAGQRGRVFLVAWTLVLGTGVGSALAGVVPDGLYQKAHGKGSVRVIVHLRATVLPEGWLGSAHAVARQRQDIAARRAVVLAELAGSRYRMVREFEAIPFVALEAEPDAMSVLEASPHVMAVEEDRIERASLSQSVPLIGADQAWAAGFDGEGIVVAILDTGVDKTHPFLAGKVVEEACYSDKHNCPNGLTSQTGPGAGVPCTYAPDSCRHGTHVAGIAAGSGVTFSGVARGAKVMSVQVFSKFTGADCDDGEDPCTRSFVSDQIAALERVFALRNQYTFAAVNMSLGGGEFTSPCDSQQTSRKAAIDNLRSVGIATVAAAGNEGLSDALNAPACISTAISVGSTTKSDGISIFSNSASFLSLLAPGSSINSSVPGGGFSVFSGTSMATPHVAGAWAILKQKRPTGTVDEVLTTLKVTGVPITDPTNDVTTPRIQVNTALEAFIAPAEPFAIRLYQKVLGREPEPGGVEGWVQQLDRDRSVVPTVLAFFHSEEFLNRNTSNEEFLRICYRTFLDREPDAAGFAAFLTELRADRLTRDNLLDIFIDSDEFATLASFLPPLDPLEEFVTTLYVRILARGPDQPGLDSFVAQLTQTRTVLPTVQLVLASPEFLARNTSNTEFVTILYRVFLDRVQDAEGLAGFVAALTSGAATRDQLVLQFAASSEFQAIQQVLFP